MNDKPKTTNEATTPQQHTEIDFLYNKCDIPKYPLAFWISVPEFFEEIKRLSGTSAEINNAVVFNIMLEIYKEKEAERDNGKEVDFNFYATRKALRHLSKILYNDEDFWQK